MSEAISIETLIWGGTSFVLLLVGFIMAFAFLYQNKMARKSEDLLSATIEAQEKERTRVAEEIHDGVQQEIAAIKMNLERAVLKLEPDGEVKDILKEAAIAAGQTVDGLRKISYGLLPHTLDRFGLAELLDGMCTELNNDSLAATFTLVGVYERQPSGVELGLYRVVQEMVTNTLKHAEATAIEVVLNCEGNGLTLSVSDNGKGYSKKKKAEGLGLRNIESRLRNIKATYQMKSRPGQGTSIEISL